MMEGMTHHPVLQFVFLKCTLELNVVSILYVYIMISDNALSRDKRQCTMHFETNGVLIRKTYQRFRYTDRYGY
jgi:hypothetical protein